MKKGAKKLNISALFDSKSDKNKGNKNKIEKIILSKVIPINKLKIGFCTKECLWLIAV